jgi:hypothetical protein
MKNVLLVLALMLIGSVSFAGDCSNGVCSVGPRPVRKVLEVTKNVVTAPVRVVANAVTTVRDNRCCHTRRVCRCR